MFRILVKIKFRILVNIVCDCVVALWEGPQLLLAKVKDADGQDWYIFQDPFTCSLLLC